MTGRRVINQALRLAQLRRATSLPASLIPVLGEVGITRGRQGKPIELSTGEALRLRERIILRHELAREAAADPGFRICENGDRIALARQIGNEKISRHAVTAMRPPVPRDAVLVREQDRADYRVVPVEEARDLVRGGLILVENWQAFESFEQLVFPVPRQWARYPVLYRGDPEARQASCEELIAGSRGEVVVFPDYDPWGLVCALAVPRMRRILWPGPEMLNAAIRDAGSSDRKYYRQVGRARARLDASRQEDVAQIWKIIDGAGRVPAQEFFFRSSAIAAQ